MTQEMVSQHEMGQAMNKMATGILHLLGIAPTAEMSQTPWLPTSDNQPVPAIVDLGKLADVVHDLAHNNEQMKAAMSQAQHPYGLCHNEGCPTCGAQRRVLTQSIAAKIEKASLAQAGAEIDLACQWANQTALRDSLSTVLAAYRKAGSPGSPQSEPELELVVTPS